MNLTTFLFACLSVISLTAVETVHVFGNSHAGAFLEIPGCVVHFLGARTMHRMGRDGIQFLDLKQHGILDGANVVFAFGEIDVRCHIGKQRDLTNRSVDEIIDTLVVNFIRTIQQNCLFYHTLSPIVYSVTPPSLGIDFPDLFPIYGSLEDRVVITRKLNQRLFEVCSENDIPFLDVYDDYSNEDGTLNLNLSHDTVHIDSDSYAPIEAKLNQIIENFYQPKF